jgi:hypothetical protein
MLIMELQIPSSSDEESDAQPEGTQEPEVKIHPSLRRQLRDNQIEGVKFMYDCIMGRRGNFTGSILAVSST